jgi:hypothetical protein
LNRISEDEANPSAQAVLEDLLAQNTYLHHGFLTELNERVSSKKGLGQDQEEEEEEENFTWETDDEDGIPSRPPWDLFLSTRREKQRQSLQKFPPLPLREVFLRMRETFKRLLSLRNPSSYNFLEIRVLWSILQKELKRIPHLLQPQDVQIFLSLEKKWMALLTNETLSKLHGLSNDESLNQAREDLAQVHARISRPQLVQRPVASRRHLFQGPGTSRKRPPPSEKRETSRKRQQKTDNSRAPRTNLPARLTQTLRN